MRKEPIRYIAWVRGQSIATGATKAQCESRARHILLGCEWFGDPPSVVYITTGPASQRVVAEIGLTDGLMPMPIAEL